VPAKNRPGQQNKVWPPATTDWGTAAAEPLLRAGDMYFNTSSGLYRQCSSATFPATWTNVSTPPPATNFQLAGSTNEVDSLIDIEQVIGGFVFNGASYSVITHRIVARFSPGTAGNARVRLYDMGPVAGPAIVPVLRSTLSIAFADAGVMVRREATLTVSGAPGVNANQIFNTARIYEIRTILDAAGPGDALLVHWAGIEVS